MVARGERLPIPRLLRSCSDVTDTTATRAGMVFSHAFILSLEEICVTEICRTSGIADCISRLKPAASMRSSFTIRVAPLPLVRNWRIWQKRCFRQEKGQQSASGLLDSVS